jgi:hypothetical protein
LLSDESRTGTAGLLATVILHLRLTWKGTVMAFAYLKDPTTDVQLLIRDEHVSSVEIRKDDGAITVFLLGGQVLNLTHEQSKQYVQHIKTHMQTGP